MKDIFGEEYTDPLTTSTARIASLEADLAARNKSLKEAREEIEGLEAKLSDKRRQERGDLWNSYTDVQSKLEAAREEIEGLKRKMEATAARCNPDRRNFWDDREQLMNERDELKWKLALVDKRLEVIQSQAKGCILNSEEE